MTREFHALLWAFDRLNADCNDEKTNKRTAKEIGNVLLGKPSPAATYVPDQFQDSSKLLEKAKDDHLNSLPEADINGDF